MANENETVMAVCAEWRDCIESADPSVWNDERIAGLVKTTKAQQLEYLARIEAAARRDAAIHAMTCEANERLREHLEIALEDNGRPVGNAAAMREALATLRKRFDNNTMAYQDRYFKFSGWHWHKKAKEAARWRDVFQELREACDAALSAPARQCDVGTPEEQDRRWGSNCGHGIPRCCKCAVYAEAKKLGLVNHRYLMKSDCKFVWAQMPYEAEKGANDGSDK